MSGFRHEKLEVWHKAMAWAQSVYTASAAFPTNERFGLTNQLRRAALSVSSNIAEGSGRWTDADFVRFIEIAYGSLMEAVSQLEMALRLGYIDAEHRDALRNGADDIARMLSGLRDHRRTKQTSVEGLAARGNDGGLRK